MLTAERADRLSDRLQVAGYQGLVAGLSRLGWRRASALGAALGTVVYRALRIRRVVVEEQIAAAFPELSERSVRGLARGAYESLGRTAMETALLPSLPREGVLALVARAENWEAVTDALALGRGLLVVTGHLGNWELAGAYLVARGIATDAVARRMSNQVFDDLVRETRMRLGLRIVHEPDAVRSTPRALRAGRAVGFLIDQGALGPASTFVPFFGRLAKTPRGPAVFALRLKVPLVYGAALRQPDGRFQILVERIPVVDTGDRERDVDGIVAAYTAALERHVRLAPEQYFWHHRRWKWQPPYVPSGRVRIGDHGRGADPRGPASSSETLGTSGRV